MDKIPHILHFCWFGNKKKPQIVQRCIASWEKCFPGWKIQEWNENNFDVQKSPYSAGAYAAKKYAFVADYARFDILYRYGGVYVDTDVEFLKPLPEEFLQKPAFAGMESNYKVNPGLIFGTSAGHPFLKEMLKIYESNQFPETGGIEKTVVDYTTELLTRHGYREDCRYQKIMDVSIYPPQYFCSYNLDIHEIELSPESISVHHYAASWVSPKSRIRRKILTGIKKVLGVKNYTFLLMWKRKRKAKMS